MSRNRLKNSQSLHWMGVVKWILIAGMLAGLGLCYVLCKNRNISLAQDTLRVEKQLHAVEISNEGLEADLQHMKSPARLQHQLTFIRSTLITWGDPRANWLPWEQNTRARLAHIGATPRTNLNIDATPVAAAAPQH